MQFSPWVRVWKVWKPLAENVTSYSNTSFHPIWQGKTTFFASLNSVLGTNQQFTSEDLSRSKVIIQKVTRVRLWLRLWTQGGVLAAEWAELEPDTLSVNYVTECHTIFLSPSFLIYKMLWLPPNALRMLWQSNNPCACGTQLKSAHYLLASCASDRLVLGWLHASQSWNSTACIVQSSS